MNKKAYIIPEMTVVRMTAMQPMLGYSGKGTDGVKTKDTPDNSDDPNRSRGYNAWEEEDEDF